MNQIICPLSYIPIRKEANHKTEQISQLLFGETASIEETSDEWLYINTTFDSYKGWVEKKCVQYTSSQNEFTVIKGFSRLVRLNGESLWLSSGSELNSELIDKQSATVVTINRELNSASVIELALQFIGTPYLWGGRSFMGIDCSGFVQVIFKALNIKLPRDASQQVDLGTAIQFPSDAQVGDLAFFDDEEAAITHVGIIMGEGKIIHASGSVRIDSLDHQGIFNSELNKYTHKLRVIKRL